MAGDAVSVVLRELLLTTKDGDWGKESPESGFVPYRVIRGTDFPDIRVGDTKAVPVRYLSETTVGRRTLQPDDILLETAGGSPGRPTGRSALIREELLSSLDLPATCASFARFLRVDPSKAIPRYVYWYLQYLYASGQMEEHQVQHTGIARFQYTKFAETEQIPLPDPAEQRAIAYILGTLDDKIELNRRMNATLEEMARALFKSWFVDFDPVRAKMEARDTGLPREIADLFPDGFEESAVGEVPRGWRVQKLSDLCSTQYGYTASAIEEPVGPKLLRVMDINKRNWIDWGNVPHCRLDDDSKRAYALKIGDLVVARMADPGKSAIIEEDVDAVFASYLVRLKADSLARSYYLYGFLKSDRYAEYAAGARSGSVQANMNAKVIVGATVIVPPNALMEYHLQAVLPLRQRLVANVRESRTLAALRDALLPKLISGEVRVGDAARFVGAAT
jgi:type I restriction enzyme, S subunit